MSTDDLREFLRGRGCPDDVVAGGLEGLVAAWEHTVAQVEGGYPLGLDDYLNDLDGRQLLADALNEAPEGVSAPLRPRVEAADQRMRRHVSRVDECLWGDRVAAAEQWDAERNWWYYAVPRQPAGMLREDLEAQ